MGLKIINNAGTLHNAYHSYLKLPTITYHLKSTDYYVYYVTYRLDWKEKLSCK